MRSGPRGMVTVNHTHKWREVKRWHPNKERTAGGILTLEHESVDDQGVGHGYKRESARLLKCKCGADRVEYFEDGQWCHMYTRTWK